MRMTPQRIDDIGARARIDALERLVEQQQPRRLGMPAREHDLLLVAAGQVGDAIVALSQRMPNRAIAVAAAMRSRVRRTAPLANQRDRNGKPIVPAIDANGTLSGNSDVRQRSSPARNTPARIASAGERGRHVRPSSVISPAAARTAPKIVRAKRDLPPPSPAIATISPRRTSRSNGVLVGVSRICRTLKPGLPRLRRFRHARHRCTRTRQRPADHRFHRRVEIDRRGQIGDDPRRGRSPRDRQCGANRRADATPAGWRRRRGATRPPARTAARPPPPTGWRSARRESATMAARPAHAPGSRAAGRPATARRAVRAKADVGPDPCGERSRRRAPRGRRHAPRRAGSHSRSSSRLSAIDSVGTTASATDWCTVATPSRLAACGDAGR